MSPNASEQSLHILSAAGIFPSEVRVKILDIIIEKFKEPFSIAEIHGIIRVQNPTVSRSSIQSTLQLFHARHLIGTVPAPTLSSRAAKKKGRPELRFVSKL